MSSNKTVFAYSVTTVATVSYYYSRHATWKLHEYLTCRN